MDSHEDDAGGAQGTAAVAAATVILVRDGVEGAETLMLRRSSRLAFAGGMWVFPGGRVDDGDRDGLSDDDELGAARRAAVREAREEAGLDVRLDHLVNIYSYAGRAPVIIVYAATKLSGELVVDDEGLEAREFDLDEIPWDDLAFRSTREALRDYIDGRITATVPGQR
jgi:8-oxo-dGTP pyrophosphatase MutT (NUDIX family)